MSILWITRWSSTIFFLARSTMSSSTLLFVTNRYTLTYTHTETFSPTYHISITAVLKCNMRYKTINNTDSTVLTLWLQQQRSYTPGSSVQCGVLVLTLWLRQQRSYTPGSSVQCGVLVPAPASHSVGSSRCRRWRRCRRWPGSHRDLQHVLTRGNRNPGHTHKQHG